MFDWVLPFLGVLGLLIFVHELGHFIAAKRAGITVTKFSLGFPPNIFTKKWGDTEYCIGIIPLGGYVRMKGDIPDFAEDDSIPEGGPDEFLTAPKWKRATVIAAGPFMNFVTAFLLYFIIIWAWGNPLMREGSAELGDIAPDTPAEQAGLMAGDVILSLDGVAIGEFDDMSEYVKSRPDQDIVFKFSRGGEEMLATVHTLKIETVDSLGNTSYYGLIGVNPVFDFHPSTFKNALLLAPVATFEAAFLTLDFVWGLISRRISIDNLGGPVIIARESGRALKRGLPYLLNLAAFLSVNLGVLNILPIPVLDGGHLVFLSIEAIRRKPISFKKRLFWQQIGMGLLLLLMVFVTYNDILKLFKGG